MIKYIWLNSYNECLYDLNGEKIILPNYKKIDISRKLRFDDTKEIPQKSEGCFIDYNLKLNFRKFNEGLWFWLQQAYNDKNEGSRVRNDHFQDFLYSSNNDKNFIRDLTKNEIKEVLNELNNIKNKYIERLKKYYKRYNKCIYNMGYWVDR